VTKARFQILPALGGRWALLSWVYFDSLMTAAGLEGLNKSIVWVFLKLVVCLHCGFAEFAVPERELQVLEKGSPLDGAVVLEEESSQPSPKCVSRGMND